MALLDKFSVFLEDRKPLLSIKPAIFGTNIEKLYSATEASIGRIEHFLQKQRFKLNGGSVQPFALPGVEGKVLIRLRALRQDWADAIQ